MRKLRKNLKWMLVWMLLALVAIFSVQNAALVEIQFLAWTGELRRFVVIAISLSIGGFIGWIVGTSARR